jgi:hypothetical protein
MPTRFSLPTAKFGFDGSLLMTQWNGTTNSETWSFPTVSAQFLKDDNVHRPMSSDANSNMHLQNKGLRVGTLEFSAPLMLDRNMITFINSATQNATRGYPFQMALTPFASGGTQIAGNIFIRQVRLASQTAVDGRTSMFMLQVTAWVCDPDNAQSLTTLTGAATLGTNGAGITSFMRSSLVDTSATPLDYRMTEIILTHDNNMTVSPTRVPSTIYSEGGIPGQRTGSLSVRQDKNATNPLPQASGLYPFVLTLPTGDLTHTATINIATSFDRQNQNIQPDQLVRNGVDYSLFSPTSGTDLMTLTYV